MRGDMTSIQGKLEVMETKQVTKKKSVGKKFCKICSIFALPPKKVNVNPTIDTQEESHQANMGTHER